MNLFKKGLVVFTAIPLLMSSSITFAQDTGQVQSNKISNQHRISTDKFQININKNEKNPNNDSIADLQSEIERLAKAGEFVGDGSVHALLLHVTAVDRYAKQGQVKKVVKHMKGFQVLLKEQLKKKTISKRAYNILHEDSNMIISKYAVTQPVFSYKDAIREKVYVETDMDTDMDGKPDQVAVDIIRPRETGNKIKVPVIMDASPYYESLGRGNESELKEWDKDGKPVKFPLYYDNYFVPRGYAVVLADMIGTSNSDGCPTTGGTEDIESMKAVVDWLNGRAKAKTSSGTEVVADWSNGKVGMIGKSYDGTLANGVAATGVDGLKTIVPISAISNWYDYYRYSGIPYYRGGPAGLANTVVSTRNRNICKSVRDRLTAESDDNTGNYNHFWDKRNYFKDAGKVKASVFAIHGLNDYNVKTNHFSQWWDELGENDVPRKLWLSRTGHVDPFDFRREEWVDTIHLWFDHWLQDIDNGVMNQPSVDVQRRDLSWETHANWPDQKMESVKMHFNPSTDGDPAGPGILTTDTIEGKHIQRFTDDPRQTEKQMVENEMDKKDHRLVFLTPKLKKSVRISGTPKINLKASVDKTDTNFTALLVDYGMGVHVAEDVKTLDEKDCWGENSSNDNACYRRTEMVTHMDPYEIVTRSWMSAKNWKSMSESSPLTPNEDYWFRWNVLPEDYVFEKGHRIGVIIAASDRSWTLPAQTQATIETILGDSHIALPVVGGKKSLGF